MRKVVTRWSLNITRPRGDKKQLVGQFQVQKLAYCHLKFGKLVSAVKQPIWYVYNSIPDPNLAVIYLNQMFFIVLYSSANKKTNTIIAATLGLTF